MCANENTLPHYVKKLKETSVDVVNNIKAMAKLYSRSSCNTLDTLMKTRILYQKFKLELYIYLCIPVNACVTTV